MKAVQLRILRLGYGYEWKDRKLVSKPEEAVVRKKAYELFLQHRRKGKVANLLNAAGYHTRGGVLWRDSQVYRVLTDPSAKGIYYFNRMRQLEKSWQTVPKPENEWEPSAMIFPIGAYG